jgi:pentatricopeptide repeat protein
VIKAYARIGNVVRADALLLELEDITQQSFDKRVDQSTAAVITIGACIDAWAKDRSKNINHVIERSERLLQIIINKYREGEVGPYEKHVDTWVFEAVIRIWSRSRKPEAGDRIEALIDEMEDLNRDVPGLFHPTSNMFVLALDAWAITGREDAGKHALALVRKMRKLHESGKIAEPNIRAISSALASVTRSSGKGSVKTAEALYQDIIALFIRGDRSATVNARTLTALLSSILKAPDPDASTRAVKVLQQTIELGKDDLSDLAPNTIVFNCVLNGLARRLDGDEAWFLFQQMKELPSKGYDSTPDAVSYSCVARAVVGGHPSVSMERLDKLSSEIVQLFQNGDLKADVQLFNTVIHSYSILAKQDPMAATKADELLTCMELSTLGDNPMHPDLRTLTGVCHAFAMSRGPNSVENAEATLLRAQSLASEGKIDSPNTELFSDVVLAYSRSRDVGSLEKAEGVVEKMEALYKEGDEEARPNAYTYNILLAACANSRDPAMVEKAVAVFEKLNKSSLAGVIGCGPDVNSFNWVSFKKWLV